MYRMRTLILYALLGGQCISALAAAPSLRLGSTVKTESGSTGRSSDGVGKATAISSTVDASTGGLQSWGELGVGVELLRPDYSRYLITDRDGTTRPLNAGSTDAEWNGRANLRLYAKQATFTIEGQRNLTATPFPGYSAKAGLQYDAYAWGSRFGAAVSRTDRRIPNSYFIHPENLRSEQRPARSLENKIGLFWEQVLNERWKVRWEGFGAELPRSRPRRYGLSLQAAWAFADEWALITGVGGIRERSTDSLYDERGRFSATWGETELRFEPRALWLLSLRLGTALERESGRGVSAARRVGTDSVGLEVRKSNRFGDLAITASGAFSNTGYRVLQAGGNFTWNL